MQTITPNSAQVALDACMPTLSARLGAHVVSLKKGLHTAGDAISRVANAVVETFKAIAQHISDAASRVYNKIHNVFYPVNTDADDVIEANCVTVEVYDADQAKAEELPAPIVADTLAEPVVKAHSRTWLKAATAIGTTVVAGTAGLIFANRYFADTVPFAKTVDEAVKGYLSAATVHANAAWDATKTFTETKACAWTGYLCPVMA